MKNVGIIVILLALLTTTAYPCFDTYLFLRKGSMVYPYRSSVFELNGEYSVNSLNNPQNDMFFSNGSFYYGAARDFSFQVTLGSGEKPRGDFKIDTYALRGVYNLYYSGREGYTLDVIAEQSGKLTAAENEVGISFPNIFHNAEFTYVVHPTASYAIKGKELALGGHLGLFYDFNETGIVGFGTEYKSVQSSSYAGNRITESEASASLFLGAHIGSALYLQNEIAKGLANSRDFGFALTTKFIF